MLFGGWSERGAEVVGGGGGVVGGLTSKNRPSHHGQVGGGFYCTGPLRPERCAGVGIGGWVE